MARDTRVWRSNSSGLSGWHMCTSEGELNMRRWQSASLAALMTSVVSFGAALADQPKEKGLGLQAPVTEVGRDITNFHDWILMPIITIISIFVAMLLLYCIVRFNKKANPVPAKFTHNTAIEVVWTLIPVLILVGISAFSFPLLYKADVVPAKVDMTIKVTGHQWYWSYEYPDQNGISFDANALTAEDAKTANKPYLLAADNAVYVPVNKTIRLQLTASDVIHGFLVPAFGIQMDASPGRLGEMWFKAEKVGTYYGQCTQICGIKHAYMPIEVKVVTQPEFDAWVASQQSAQNIVPAATQLAAASTPTPAPNSAALAQAN
jgi:cytochrome c oxidase subunit II